jgi:hypothetical protein
VSGQVTQVDHRPTASNLKGSADRRNQRLLASSTAPGVRLRRPRPRLRLCLRQRRRIERRCGRALLARRGLDALLGRLRGTHCRPHRLQKLGSVESAYGSSGVRGR